jgi:hypothetical protein
MALKPCVECKQEVSTEARVCPHCGKRLRASRLGVFLKVFVLLAVLVGLWWAFLGPKGRRTASEVAESLAGASGVTDPTGTYSVTVLGAFCSQADFDGNDDKGGFGGNAPDLYVRVDAGGRVIFKNRRHHGQDDFRMTWGGGNTFEINYTRDTQLAVYLMDADAMNDESVFGVRVRNPNRFPLQGRVKSVGGTGSWIEFNATKVR